MIPELTQKVHAGLYTCDEPILQMGKLGTMTLKKFVLSTTLPTHFQYIGHSPDTCGRDRKWTPGGLALERMRIREEKSRHLGTSTHEVLQEVIFRNKNTPLLSLLSPGHIDLRQDFCTRITFLSSESDSVDRLWKVSRT